MKKFPNILQEKVRKKVSDKVHFLPNTGKVDIKKIIIAKTKRRN
jgi:hypothetical protein